MQNITKEKHNQIINKFFDELFPLSEAKQEMARIMGEYLQMRLDEYVHVWTGPDNEII